MPFLSRIKIYPIKSLDGCELSTARVLPSGALKGDRRFALVDDEEKYVNGKRFAAIHTIRAEYHESLESVRLSSPTGEASFSLQHEREQIAVWCSDVLGVSCRLVENVDNGFPDDVDAAGPTIISTATLSEISDWFGLDVAEVRRRLRANLEINAEPAFWEDRLVGQPDEVRRFRIGPTAWQGCGISKRCAVPTRDSQTGEVDEDFAVEFSRRREQSLPEWSPSERFDHYYRTAINTSLESLVDGDIISVGDPVELSQGAAP